MGLWYGQKDSNVTTSGTQGWSDEAELKEVRHRVADWILSAREGAKTKRWPEHKSKRSSSY